MKYKVIDPLPMTITNGNTYFSIITSNGEFAIVEDTWEDCSLDEQRNKSNNIFLKESDAIDALRRIEEVLKCYS